MIFDNYSKNGLYITEADDDEDNYDIQDDDQSTNATNDDTANQTDDSSNDNNDQTSTQNADDDEDNYDVQDDNQDDNEQNQDDQNNDDSQNNDQDTNNEDNYDIQDDEEDSSQNTGDQGEDETSTGNSSDEESQQQNGDDPRAKLQALEKSIFDQLSPEQQQSKIKELKDLFITAHEKCQEVINMVSNSEKDPQQAKIYDYIVSRLADLKNYITDYMRDIFDSKTYLENMTEFQKYLTVFDTIKNIFDEINKESHNK